MSQEEKKGRVLFRVVKGFIYGNVLGIFLGIAIYLFASAVKSIVTTIPDPALLFGIIYSASILAGVGVEYSDWLESRTK